MNNRHTVTIAASALSWTVQDTNQGFEIWNFHNDGGPIIRETADGSFDLFEVPQYGGEEIFCGKFVELAAAIKKAETFV